jgi:hypothetical protein
MERNNFYLPDKRIYFNKKNFIELEIDMCGKSERYNISLKLKNEDIFQEIKCHYKNHPNDFKSLLYAFNKTTLFKLKINIYNIYIFIFLFIYIYLYIIILYFYLYYLI